MGARTPLALRMPLAAASRFMISCLLAHVARAGFGVAPAGSFCGSVESGEGKLNLNLTFTSPCRMSLTGGSTGAGDCSGEDFKFDSSACYSQTPTQWENCSVQLPHIKNGSDCFKMQGIRAITFDMCTKRCTGPPRAHIYAFTDTAYIATLSPCGTSPDRFRTAYAVNGTVRPHVGPVQCGIELQKDCGTAQPKGTAACMECAGAHAVELVKAGCADSDIRSYCGTKPVLPQQGCDGLSCCSHACGSFGKHGCNYLATCGGCDCCHWTNPIPGGVPCDCSC